MRQEFILDACEVLAERINIPQFLPKLEMLGIERERAETEILLAKQLLSRKSLEDKIKLELGDYSMDQWKYEYRNDQMMGRKLYPLGSLLHIGAGNVHGLSAYSVIEGLLTGNKNYVKLPKHGDPVSEFLLQQLVEIQPGLREFIQVSHTLSSDKKGMETMVKGMDGIVVWGGDEAVRSIRRIADPGTKLIEWGHKLSFAYVSEEGMERDSELEDLAEHICKSNQLYCSSCQGIYLGISEKKQMQEFGRKFLGMMECFSGKYPLKLDQNVQGKLTLLLRAQSLERGKLVKKGNSSSITLSLPGETRLEPSLLYRNLWVKALPEQQMKKALSGDRRHIHTVGLICKDEERGRLEDLLLETGAVRVCRGGGMSDLYGGLPHDGEFPLRRYVKIVSVEGKRKGEDTYDNFG